MPPTKRTRTEQKARKLARQRERAAQIERRAVMIRKRTRFERIRRSPMHAWRVYRALRLRGARRITSARSAIAFAVLTWRQPKPRDV